VKEAHVVDYMEACSGGWGWPPQWFLVACRSILLRQQPEIENFQITLLYLW